MQILAIPASLGTLGKYNNVEKSPELILKDIPHKTIKPAVSNQEDFLDQIHAEAKGYKTLIAVGGDHSISYPCVFAFKERYPDGKVIILDAHPDCEVHTETPTHEDWLRMLIEGGVVRAADVVFFGVRRITKRERDFMKKNRLKVHKTLPEIDAPIYLSIDIDVLDPDECDGFYFKEKNGLKVAEIASIVKELKPHVKLADIVEAFPEKKAVDIARQILSILI